MQHYMESSPLKTTLATLLFALIFLVAPFYYHDNIGGTGLNLPGNITVWLAVSVFIWFAVNKVLKQKSITFPKNISLVLAFPILATVSGFVSGVSEPLDWAFRLLFVWGGVLFLLALFQFEFTRAQKDRLLFILTVAGLLHAVVACVQSFQPEGIVFFLPTAPSNIPTGVFQQINVHATFQATVLLLCWYLSARPLARTNLLIKITLLITTFFATYLVMISGSRVGVISLFVGLALLVCFCLELFKRNKKTIFLLSLTMLLAITVSLFSDGLLRLANKSAVVHSEYGASERIGIYRISAELIEQSPVYGHGLGSFPSVWQYQKADFQQRYPDYSLIDKYVSHPHNELLFWQVEGGFLASIGILVSFLAIFMIAWKSKARYAIALLFPFAFHNQVELPFHISATAWFATLFIIFVALSHSKKQVTPSFLSIPMTKTLSLVNYSVLIVATIFFGHSALANYQLEMATKPKQNANLSIPLANPFFTKIAEDFRMQQIFRQSSMEHNVAAMQFFNDWQEEEIKNRPTAYNFKMLIASYQNLQQVKKACLTAQLALNMYYKNQEFEHYVDSCQK